MKVMIMTITNDTNNHDDHDLMMLPAVPAFPSPLPRCPGGGGGGFSGTLERRGAPMVHQGSVLSCAGSLALRRSLTRHKKQNANTTVGFNNHDYNGQL